MDKLSSANGSHLNMATLPSLSGAGIHHDMIVRNSQVRTRSV